MGAASQLEQGRRAYAAHAWSEAEEALARADEESGLDAEDLQLLATATHMLDREDDWFVLLERLYRMHEAEGRQLRAVRSAFWLGMQLTYRGDMAQGAGWLARAQRLLGEEDGDCIERGYLLLPEMFRRAAAGEFDGAAAAAGEAAAYARRFADPDLFALAVHSQGWMEIRAGRVPDGLALLDEAMVGVTAGEASPIVTGIVYCAVIGYCQQRHELRRAREWTSALSRWCEEQPELVAFTGRCLVHRAEIMQVEGAWDDALAEAERAGLRLEGAPGASIALYRLGELHRLRGELGAAERAYAEASALGWEPQPGLALLRLAQGKDDAAVASIRRVSAETRDPMKRTGLLAAAVEILLAAGEEDEAQAACRELETLAASLESDALDATVAHAHGAVELAGGNARDALPALRRAAQEWQELEAPYEAARARVLVGLACRDQGDEDGAELELTAARGDLRATRGGHRSRPPRRPRGGPDGCGRPRPHGTGARRPPARRRRQEQPGDRRRARDQRAHGRAPPAEHLHEAPSLLPDGGRGLRLRARAPLSRRGQNSVVAARARLADPPDAAPLHGT